jgi:hypothetical protein
MVKNPQPEKAHHSLPSPSIDVMNDDLSEVRFQNFLVETEADAPILTCAVSVGGVSLGRLPIATLELPLSVEFPLRPHDRLRLQIHGIGTHLTAKATQALQGLCLTILQRGLRTRATDQNSPAKPTPTAELQ